MSNPTGYGNTDLLGLLYLEDGETLTEEGELASAQAVERVVGTALEAIGAGVYSGGACSLVGGSVVIEAIVAAASDASGIYPLARVQTTLGAALFANGADNYVHLVAGETARLDGSCSYTVSGSVTPPTGGVLVCQVTKTAGVLAAVDASVRGKLPMLAELWAALGLAEDRLATLELLITEGGGAGEGGLGPIFASLLAMSATDGRLVPQYITDIVNAAVAAHAAETGGGSGVGASGPSHQRDDDSYNLGMLALTLTQWLPDAAMNQRNVATIVTGVYGDGSGADGIDFRGAGSEW